MSVLTVTALTTATIKDGMTISGCGFAEGTVIRLYKRPSRLSGLPPSKTRDAKIKRMSKRRYIKYGFVGTYEITKG